MLFSQQRQMSGLPPVDSGINPPANDGGITPDFLQQFQATKYDGYQCLLAYQLPTPPWSDTSKDISPAWTLAVSSGVVTADYRKCGNNTSKSGCACDAMKDPAGTLECNCIIFPDILGKATFNLGQVMAPTTSKNRQDCMNTCNASSESEAGVTQIGCPANPMPRCNGRNQDPENPCCPDSADDEDCNCPAGGYIYKDGSSDGEPGSCTCYSVQPWYLQGECSPWGSLNPQQQATINKLYWNMKYTIDGKTVSMQDLLASREACVQDEIEAANKKQHDAQMTKAIIALVFVLICCVIVYFMVRSMFRSK